MPLETNRLVIRAATAGDVEFIAALHTNETVQRHVGGVHDSFENTVAHIRKHLGHIDDFHIITLKEDGAPVGAVAFVRNRHLNEDEPLIELMPEHFGKGYGSEALSVIREWWLARNGIDHIYATAQPQNVSSIALLKKCGFQLSGECQNPFESRQLIFKYERANT